MKGRNLQRRGLALTLLVTAACSSPHSAGKERAPQQADVYAEGLTTQLHRPSSGAVYADLTAVSFGSDLAGDTRNLSGVTLKLRDQGLELRSDHARLKGDELRLSGLVRGLWSDGRGFRTPQVDYHPSLGVLALHGPVVFHGSGHRIIASGGAVVDDGLAEIELRGPVQGHVQP